MATPRCQHPGGIIIRPNGRDPLMACTYTPKEIHHNVTVRISQCERCGHIDFSWFRQDDTESEYLGVLKEGEGDV